MLAGGESGPESLAVDATNVYWTNYSSGEIRKVPKGGGQAVTVYSATNTYPWGIAVDGRALYWTTPNFFTGGGSATVMALPFGQDVPTVLSSNPNGPQSIVVSPTDVYWTEGGPDAVRATSLDGGNAQSIAIDPGGGGGLAIDANHLYWTMNGAVYQASLAGGPATPIAAPSSALASDGTNVYLALASTLGIGEIARVPVGGGPQTTLATGRTPGISGLAVDSRNVYWLEANGTIDQGAVAALPKSGGQVAILASGLGDLSAIAVDDTAVYFIASGNIEKIAKGP